MTIATLLLTCLIFLVLGWTAPQYRLVAISIAAVVCIASSNGGTTSQDLKTGFLVGATPKWQQWSILVGSVSSALVIGVILLAMNASGTVYSQKEPRTAETAARHGQTAGNRAARACTRRTIRTEYYVWHADGRQSGRRQAGQISRQRRRENPLAGRSGHQRPARHTATTERKSRSITSRKPELFALITDGILNQKLPWTLVALGAIIAVVVELCGVSSLAVRRRHVSAAVVFDADLRRRLGSIRRRSRGPQAVGRPGFGIGIGDESRNAAFDRLYRRRQRSPAC